MRGVRSLVTLSMVVVIVVSGSASLLRAERQEAVAITNTDVVNMASAKLSDAVIIKTIESAPQRRFDLTPAGIIALKTAGVSEAVILAMQHSLSLPSSALPPPTGIVELLRVSAIDQFFFVSVVIRNSRIQEVPIGDSAAAQLLLNNGSTTPVAAFVLLNTPTPELPSTAVLFGTKSGGQARLRPTELTISPGETVTGVPARWKSLVTGTRFLPEGIRLEMLFEDQGASAGDIDSIRVLNFPALKVPPSKIVPFASPSLNI